MGDATARWLLPTVRASGLPMDPAHVKHIEVALAVVGGPFSPLEIVPPPKLDHVIPDLSPGNYLCRLVAVDLESDRGEATELPFTIPDTSPPGPVENASVTVT